MLLVSLLVTGWLILFWLVVVWRKNSINSRPMVEPTTKPAGLAESKITPTTVPISAEGKSQEGVVLAIEVPKENETTPLAAELMFASLHGIYRPELDKRKDLTQEHVAFELQAKEKSIRFFVWVPRHLQGYVEGQVYAQYPGVNVYEVKDYAKTEKVEGDLSAAAAELSLVREDIFPIKGFDNFDVDPLAGITATLSKLEGVSQVRIQILMRPESDAWRNRAINYIAAIKAGKKDFKTTLIKGLTGLASDVVRTAISGQPTPPLVPGKVELAPGVDEVLKRIEEKSNKLGFQTRIRIVALDQSIPTARQKLDLVVGSFKQFNTTNLNGFVASPISASAAAILRAYEQRQFGGSGSVLNVAELASIYHLPSKTVTTPHIVWAGSKKGEPPANLPLADEIPAEELTNLGLTDFRGSTEKFGIKIKDRRRHIYIIGKSGVGKSTLLENMTLDDIRERRGVGVVDPHGEYVDYVLERIPSYRVNDVIIFDPGDRAFPIGFNVLEVDTPDQKVVTASGVVGVFKKIFGESWGPRLEYWLSSAILALLDYPDATLMMVPRLFTDDIFRAGVIDVVKDPVIKQRWLNEYDRLDQRQRNETISPILNKVGQFLSSSVIRNIVGQPKSSIDMRQVMDEGKIVLIKLAKGLIGEDNAALLGALMITKLQLAALSRADVEETKRPDFFLYVDEFQNFATDSFATILSEARKYHLSLTLANQYMSQLSDTVKNAIFGNVGTLISFRVGGDDAGFLTKEFAPVFDEQDLVNLDIFKIYLKLSIDGLTANAFSAVTLPPSTDQNQGNDKIIKLSRERYAKDVAFVEGKVLSSADVSAALSSAGQSRPPQSSRYSQRPQMGNRAPYAPSYPASPAYRQPGLSASSSAPTRQGPKVDLLKNLISKVERQKQTPLSESEKADVAKTLMNDLKDADGSMKDALDRARKQREEEQKNSSELKPNETIKLDDDYDPHNERR